MPTSNQVRELTYEWLRSLNEERPHEAVPESSFPEAAPIEEDVPEGFEAIPAPESQNE